MHLVQTASPAAASTRKAPVEGFVGALLARIDSFTAVFAGKPARRHMQVIETLAVGGRRQLMLVSCGGERFLVGTSTDGIGTIVRVRPEQAARGIQAAARGVECV